MFIGPGPGPESVNKIYGVNVCSANLIHSDWLKFFNGQ